MNLPNIKYDKELLIKVADLYYKRNYKQEKIARRLKISKYKVCRTLKKAHETGVVEININYK